MRLGTRRRFLIMQTDISGIELAPPRHRLTAYLPGIAFNLSVASALVPVLAATDPASTAHRLSSAALLLALMPLPFQLMVFTRTDVYVVLQDLTGCRDLYGDGLAYARYRYRRALRALRPGARAAAGEDDPSARLPRHERRAVRVHSVVLVVGTAAPRVHGRRDPAPRHHPAVPCRTGAGVRQHARRARRLGGGAGHPRRGRRALAGHQVA